MRDAVGRTRVAGLCLTSMRTFKSMATVFVWMRSIISLNIAEPSCL